MPPIPRGSPGLNGRFPDVARIVAVWLAALVWALLVAWLLGRGVGPGQLPAVPASEVLPVDLLEKARDFRGSLRLIWLPGQVAVLAVLAWLALYRGFPPAGLARRLALRPIPGGAALGASLAVVLYLVGLPFTFAGWRVGVEYGLLTLGFGTWLLDGLKGLLISVLLFGLAGGAATWAWSRFGRRFWLVASAGLGAFAVLWIWAWPIVIAPLFNKVEPLPAGSARSALQRIATRAGVTLEGIYTEDASRRTRAVNAYVHGFGPSRRLVVQDTALGSLDRRETEVIAAHEIAHVEYRDPERGLLFALLVIPPAALAVQFLASFVLRRRGRDPAGPLVVLPLALGVALASLALSIPGAWLSRQVEARADQRALELTLDPSAAISLQRTLARSNLQDPSPPGLWSALLGTHPSPAERVGLARAFVPERGGGGGEQ